jgi:hypothetical protein
LKAGKFGRERNSKRNDGEIDAKNARGEIYNGSRTVTPPKALLAAYQEKKCKRGI